MEEHRFVNAAAAGMYVTAGNAHFTLKSLKTGNHYSYEVASSDVLNRWFIKVLTDGNAYTYLGVLEFINEAFQVRLTRASKFAEKSDCVAAIRWFAHQLLNKGMLPDAVEMWHEGTCGRCNRPLTRPDSIELGLGPICASEMGIAMPVEPASEMT